MMSFKQFLLEQEKKVARGELTKNSSPKTTKAKQSKISGRSPDVCECQRKTIKTPL